MFTPLCSTDDLLWFLLIFVKYQKMFQIVSYPSAYSSFSNIEAQLILYSINLALTLKIRSTVLCSDGACRYFFNRLSKDRNVFFRKRSGTHWFENSIQIGILLSMLWVLRVPEAGTYLLRSLGSRYCCYAWWLSLSNVKQLPELEILLGKVKINFLKTCHYSTFLSYLFS